MILQLRRLGRSNETLEEIIREDLVALSQWKFAEIDQKYGITGSVQILELIRELNPRPSAGFSCGSPVNYVIPEITYIIHDTGGALTIETQLNNELIPKITVSPHYLELIKNADPADEPALKLYVQRLHGIIESIEKRNTTLLRVGKAIAARQKKVILGETASPEPLSMKSIAEELDLNISTISRCIRGKYVRVRDRVIPLKGFFQTGLSGTDSEVSQSQLLKVLEKLIENEDKSDPLSDEKLSALLNKQGIAIKRRTVAKYRGILNIVSASARKRKAKFNSRTTI